MKRLKLLGLAVIAMLSLTATLTAIASGARPNILPLGSETEPILANSTSGTSNFGSGSLKITSKKSEGTLDGTSEKLGTFDVLFLETENTLTGIKCKGLADTITGSVLVQGTFHIRAFTENNTLLTAAIFLLKPVHFECSGAILVVVTGCAAGAITPEETLTKTLTVTLAEKGTSGDNLIITILNEANTAAESCQLLARTGAEATKLSVEVSTQTLSNFRHDPNEAVIEVLVMRL